MPAPALQTVPEEAQFSLADEANEKIIKKLRQSDLDAMTPREALEFLYELKNHIMD